MNPILTQIITNGPSILDAASRIYERFSAKADEPSPLPTPQGPGELDLIRDEIGKIEQLSSEQAAVVHRIAEQQQALAETVSRVAIKANIGIVLATASLLISLAVAVFGG